MTIWHLPYEKRFGFRWAFSDLVRGRIPGGSSENYLPYLARVMGIPQTPAAEGGPRPRHLYSRSANRLLNSDFTRADLRNANLTEAQLGTNLHPAELADGEFGPVNLAYAPGHGLAR